MDFGGGLWITMTFQINLSMSVRGEMLVYVCFILLGKSNESRKIFKQDIVNLLRKMIMEMGFSGIEAQMIMRPHRSYSRGKKAERLVREFFPEATWNIVDGADVG